MFQRQKQMKDQEWGELRWGGVVKPLIPRQYIHIIINNINLWGVNNDGLPRTI